MFDLRRDPHEVKNVAGDPNDAEVRATLLAELKNWRENVIKDQGVSAEFRAKGVFPAERPAAVMDDWVKENAGKIDFNKHGWPAWYPTRALGEWKAARAKWEAYVFRKPDENVPRPVIAHSKRKKKKK